MIARILERLGELSKPLHHRVSPTEAAIEVFLENSKFYDRQIILVS